MTPEFDLFERRADGALTYRGLVSGLENARVRVWLLATETEHECYAQRSETREIVARIVPPWLERAEQAASIRASALLSADSVHHSEAA